MNPYSEDLRKKIVEALRRGTAKSEAARSFGVSRSSVKRYAKLAEEGRSLAPKKRPGSRPKMDESARRLLEADLEERPAATLSERREFLRRVAGLSVSESTVTQDGQAPRVQSKKRSLGADERDEFLRAAWRLVVAGEIDAERLVFVDEMGANVSLSSLYAWSRKGERAFGSAPRNCGKNVTLLASITREGLGPCLAVEGSTTREVFEAYLERVLAPTLEPGQTVVMDNLSSHKGGRVKEIIEGRGCELLYLPPYSPDFNPIEQAFSKVKGILRRAEARTREALIEAMGRALEAVSARDARGFFGHCGYNSMGQLL